MGVVSQSHVDRPRSRGCAAGFILSMGILPCLLSARAMSFHFWALREVWLCKKRAVVTSLLKAMLLEVGAGALGMCTF